MPVYFLSSVAPDYSGINDVIGTSFQAIVGNCQTVLAAILPIGLGIFAMYVTIAFSKKIFKQIVGK